MNEYTRFNPDKALVATTGANTTTTLADLTRFVDKIRDLERLERHHLRTLAVMGARDEQIAEAAVHLHMNRCLPGIGSSPAEIGTAVVEALRLCGRLPNPASEGEPR